MKLRKNILLILVFIALATLTTPNAVSQCCKCICWINPETKNEHCLYDHNHWDGTACELINLAGYVYCRWNYSFCPDQPPQTLEPY